MRKIALVGAVIAFGCAQKDKPIGIFTYGKLLEPDSVVLVYKKDLNILREKYIGVVNDKIGGSAHVVLKENGKTVDSYMYLYSALVDSSWDSVHIVFQDKDSSLSMPVKTLYPWMKFGDLGDSGWDFFNPGSDENSTIKIIGPNGRQIGEIKRTIFSEK